jgi:hypothetical protein
VPVSVSGRLERLPRLDYDEAVWHAQACVLICSLAALCAAVVLRRVQQSVVKVVWDGPAGAAGDRA